jgi:hypothetical protein
MLGSLEDDEDATDVIDRDRWCLAQAELAL